MRGERETSPGQNLGSNLGIGNGNDFYIIHHDRKWPRSWPSLDYNLLRVLRALMEERSVTRAAARLGLTQSSMSNALNRLRVALWATGYWSARAT